MVKLIIFISGRGSNMQRIIEETQNGILKGLAEVVLVFSDKPDAPGLAIAREMNIQTESLSSKGLKRKTYDEKVMEIIDKYPFDLIVLAGYMRIITPEFVRKYPKKIINIHPADTRLHQGLHAYEWAFENNLPETKITVHYVDEGMDTGKIIAQKTVNLRGCKTLEEVEQRGLAVEHELYPTVIKKITTGVNNNK